MNLWVSTADARAEDVTRADYDAAVAVLAPLYAELGVTPPPFPPRARSGVRRTGRGADRGAAADLQLHLRRAGAGDPRALSFAGIRTIGTATTVDEVRAIDAAGVDAIVATGAEAGGHRPSFLKSAEASLMGTVALVPQAADAVRTPIVAAGGIADGRGIAAALALGAAAVQIGTAFLACDESNAHPAHRAALRAAAQGTGTLLTRGFTGRLGRGLRNTLAEALESPSLARLPYPFQGHLVAELKQAALAHGRPDLAPFWSGESAPLIRHHRAAALFDALVHEMAA